MFAAGLVLGAWAALAAPFLRDTIRAGSDPTFELVSGPDYEVRFSLSPLDLITAAKDTRMVPPVWFLGPLGWTALALGAVGAVRMRRRGVFWLLLVAVGVVLALGPYLKWGDAGAVGGTTGIPLPYLLLRNLPFVSISRVPRRFVVLADLGLDVLAGCGVAFLLAWVRKRSVRLRPATHRLPEFAALVLLLALSLGELATLPQPVHKVSLSPFFSKLAGEPGDLPLLEMPITTHYVRDHARMFYQTVHGKPIFGGYIARKVHDYYSDPSSPFHPFLDLNTGPVPPDILLPLDPFAVLNYYGVPYIVYYKHDDSFEQPGDNLPWEAYLRRLFPDRSAVVADDDQLTAYRVPQVPTTELIWLGSGWYKPETVGGQTYRWSTRRSSLYIETKADETRHLRFSAATFAGEADLEVVLNGTTLLRPHITPGLGTYDAGSLRLSPGLNEIDFRSSAKSVTPAEAGGATGDKRKLAFRLTGLDLR
ncbi:MAG: hypothetical protein ACR2M0_04340 [Chloroflexia bacterium]